MYCCAFVLAFTFVASAHALTIGVRNVSSGSGHSGLHSRAGFFKRVAPVAPAGSGTFNPGQLSHPDSILPIAQLLGAEGVPGPESLPSTGFLPGAGSLPSTESLPTTGSLPGAGSAGL